MFWMLAALLALHVPAVSPGAPNKQPQLAAGGGMVALVFGSGESIWFTRSKDDGRSFEPPVKIAELPKPHSAFRVSATWFSRARLGWQHANIIRSWLSSISESAKS